MGIIVPFLWIPILHEEFHWDFIRLDPPSYEPPSYLYHNPRNFGDFAVEEVELRQADVGQNGGGKSAPSRQKVMGIQRAMIWYDSFWVLGVS